MQAELNLLPVFDCPAFFERWLADNREIMNEFIKRARQMKATGRAHYSARTIVELMRWHTDLREKDSAFKISGNVVPWMARRAVFECPELEGFFNMRDVRNDY